jgi:hypothetical protein
VPAPQYGIVPKNPGYERPKPYKTPGYSGHGDYPTPVRISLPSRAPVSRPDSVRWWIPAGGPLGCSWGAPGSATFSYPLTLRARRTGHGFRELSGELSSLPDPTPVQLQVLVIHLNPVAIGVMARSHHSHAVPTRSAWWVSPQAIGVRTYSTNCGRRMRPLWLATDPRV